MVGARNGINYKQVQRYIRLNELVPELQKMVNEKRLSFTPAVEISFIRPKNQQFIAVSIEGEQSAPSLSQAQKLRELDKEGIPSPAIWCFSSAPTTRRASAIVGSTWATG